MIEFHHYKLPDEFNPFLNPSEHNKPPAVSALLRFHHYNPDKPFDNPLTVPAPLKFHHFDPAPDPSQRKYG
jgi:hypothetical protein